MKDFLSEVQLPNAVIMNWGYILVALTVHQALLVQR